MGPSQYVQTALVAYLADPVNGFNQALAAVAPNYLATDPSIPWPFVIDWSVTSVQFFQGFGSPDDLQESGVSKYPMVFLHPMQSQNRHESMGRKFSGPVVLSLMFWFTHKATAFNKASPFLEACCAATEEACNNLFNDGNWPALYNASSAVCLPPPFTYDRLHKAGDNWRKAAGLRFTFTIDTN